MFELSDFYAYCKYNEIDVIPYNCCPSVGATVRDGDWYAIFLDFQQITRSITVDHILRTKDEILPLAKQLMQQVEFHSHPIRLLGLGVSNQKSATPQEENQWIELELEFEPWPDV